MSSPWTQEKWRDALKQVYQRAATDQNFRQQCLKDAATAIKSVSGLDVPPRTKVRFVEPTDELVLTLPRMQSDGELSDVELDQVSGSVTAYFSTSNQYTCQNYGC